MELEEKSDRLGKKLSSMKISEYVDVIIDKVEGKQHNDYIRNGYSRNDVIYENDYILFINLKLTIEQLSFGDIYNFNQYLKRLNNGNDEILKYNKYLPNLEKSLNPVEELNHFKEFKNWLKVKNI